MAEKEGVKVLGVWAGPFTPRIEMALKLKGVPYEYVEEDMSNKSPLLLELNPAHKKAPVLIHNGKPLAESLVILEYIDETWPSPPLLPRDPYQRALARFWARLVDEHVFGKGAVPMIKADASGRQVLVQEVQEKIELVEKELVGKDFFGGDTVGFLDLVVSSMIPFFLTRTWEAIGVEVISEEKFPEIYRWTSKLLEIKEVKECVSPKEKHVEFMKKRAESLRSS